MTQRKYHGLWHDKAFTNGVAYKGKLELGGKEYWMNLYQNTRKQKNSDPDFNIKIEPRQIKDAPSGYEKPAPF